MLWTGGYVMYEGIDGIYSEDYLEHHGILGQKWGVRRFQREDGTRTPAGKKRENADNDRYDRFSNSPKSGGINKKKLAKGVAVAAGVTAGLAAGTILLANPTTRSALAKYGKTAVSKIPEMEVNAGKRIGKFAAKTMNRMDNVPDRMLEAALASVGTIAINKIAAKLDPGPNATATQRNLARIGTDVATASIREVTNGKGGNNNKGNNGNNGGGSPNKTFVDRIGEPSHAGVDTSSSEYQNLINNASQSVKGDIRQMRKQGYDIDQIRRYVDEVEHAEFEDWASRYMGVEIGVM